MKSTVSSDSKKHPKHKYFAKDNFLHSEYISLRTILVNCKGCKWYNLQNIIRHFTIYKYIKQVNNMLFSVKIS